MEIRRNNFDFLRIIAAVMVLCSHQFVFVGKSEPQVFLGITPGKLGVYIFFAISGFLVTQSWERDPSAIRFVFRRFLRIWPGLFAVCCLVVFAIGPFVTTLPLKQYIQSPQTWAYFSTLLLNIRFELPGVFTSNAYPRSVNGSLWTIPLEVRWYLVVLVLGFLGVLRYRHVVLVGSVALALFQFELYSFNSSLRPNSFFEFGLFFLAGVCLSLYRSVWSCNLRLFAALLTLPAAIAFYVGHFQFALWIALPFFVVAFGLTSTPVLSRFGRFGDLSYGIYIYAFPIQQLIVWGFEGRRSFLMLFALSLLATTLAAFASWHLVEKPALGFKPRRPAR